MKLLWSNIIFALKSKAKSLAIAIINDAHIITIWKKKEICLEKSIINHQMFFGLLKEVLWLVSLTDLSIKRLVGYAPNGCIQLFRGDF